MYTADVFFSQSVCYILLAILIIQNKRYLQISRIKENLLETFTVVKGCEIKH